MDRYCEHCGLKHGETVEQSERRRGIPNMVRNPIASAVVSVRLTDDGYPCQFCEPHTNHNKHFDATTGKEAGW
jgi:hypothetical protein